MAQGGDFTRGDGRGGWAVADGASGGKFDDENLHMGKHTGRGILSMANAGPNTNGSQFFLCFDEAKHLDGKHCVFGRVIDGMEVLDSIENLRCGGPQGSDPSREIVIADCGAV